MSAPRLAAISRITGLFAEVQRVDYVDAKLLRWADFVAATQSGSGGVDDRRVWIVAVSGEIMPAFAHGERFRSAMFVVDAQSSDVLAETAGSAAWPPFFGQLKDVTGAVRPDPVVEPARASAPDNNVACGVVSPGSIAIGEGSGADELRPAVSAAYGVVPLFRGLPPSNHPAFGRYACGRFRPGAPNAGLIAYVQPGDPDYVPASALMVTGFDLPWWCRYSGQPSSELNADQVVWLLDCGPAVNPIVAQNLGPYVIDQGWAACGRGRTSASWSKDGRTIAIAAGADPATDLPRVTLRANTVCAGIR
jgi:hypothetical protein